MTKKHQHEKTRADRTGEKIFFSIVTAYLLIHIVIEIFKNL